MPVRAVYGCRLGATTKAPLGEFSQGSPPADCGATRADNAIGNQTEWEANCFCGLLLPGRCASTQTPDWAYLRRSRQGFSMRSAERDVVAAPRERWQYPTAVPGNGPVVAGRSRVGGLGGVARSTR